MSDPVSEYGVHIRKHFGWVTRTAEGASFKEAAIAAVRAESIERGLDLERIPHRAEFREHTSDDGTEWWSVVFFETERRPVFPSWANPDGMTTPGDFWFSERVNPAKPGDCGRCGATGRDFYNPLNPCGCKEATDA